MDTVENCCEKLTRMFHGDSQCQSYWFMIRVQFAWEYMHINLLFHKQLHICKSNSVWETYIQSWQAVSHVLQFWVMAKSVVRKAAHGLLHVACADCVEIWFGSFWLIIFILSAGMYCKRVKYVRKSTVTNMAMVKKFEVIYDKFNTDVTCL